MKNMDELIGKSTLSATFPLLKRVADENSLKLNRAKDFNRVRKLLSERYTLVSCKLIMIFGIFLLSSCGGSDNHENLSNTHYVNEDFKVASKWMDGRSDKFILIQRLVEDTTMYAEWETSSCGCGDRNDKKWWNYKLGDTVHFDHIRKDRFFKIENPKESIIVTDTLFMKR